MRPAMRFFVQTTGWPDIYLVDQDYRRTPIHVIESENGIRRGFRWEQGGKVWSVDTARFRILLEDDLAARRTGFFRFCWIVSLPDSPSIIQERLLYWCAVEKCSDQDGSLVAIYRDRKPSDVRALPEWPPSRRIVSCCIPAKKYPTLFPVMVGIILVLFGRR